MINPFNKNAFMLKGALYEMLLYLESQIIQAKISTLGEPQIIDTKELVLYQEFIQTLNECNDKITYHMNLIYDHMNEKK